MSDSKIVIQLSDLHIPSSSNLYDRVDSLGNVSEILRLLEAAGTLDVLLLTGDLADKGEPEAYQRLRPVIEEFSERLNVPVMYLPGNHDHRGSFRSNLLDIDDVDEKSDQVLWCGGLRIIGLDSTASDGHHGELDDEQLDWLADQLDEPAPLGTIVALHHPPIPGPIEEINLLALRQPERLGAVIANRDVKMVLAGHTHHASAGVLGAVPVWVATATAYQADVPAADEGLFRGLRGSGFTRIDVTDEGAFATHVPMLDRTTPLYEIDLGILRRALLGEAAVEEIEAAFAHAAAK